MTRKGYMMMESRQYKTEAGRKAGEKRIQKFAKSNETIKFEYIDMAFGTRPFILKVTYWISYD